MEVCVCVCVYSSAALALARWASEAIWTLGEKIHIPVLLSGLEPRFLDSPVHYKRLLYAKGNGSAISLSLC